MLFDVILPLVGLSAYVFVYRAISAPPELVGFVILGGAMSAYWMNVMWTMANQWFWEKETGNLPLYIMSPASLMAVLLGMACAPPAHRLARLFEIAAHPLAPISSSPLDIAVRHGQHLAGREARGNRNLRDN